jgi:hypothetical protein
MAYDQVWAIKLGQAAVASARKVGATDAEIQEAIKSARISRPPQDIESLGGAQVEI